MKTTYLCPKCRACINVAGNIVFSVKNGDNNEGLLLLHPNLGNYEAVHHESFRLEDGELSHFRCPACHASLHIGGGENLAKVIMIDESEQEYEIVFSRIWGEKSTHKIQGENVELFGDDSAKYVDFINLSKFD